MEGLHVTESEKQDIKLIPNIKTSLAKKVSIKPYSAENIDVELPDSNTDITAIKAELRNKVGKDEIEAINAAENERQVSEASRKNFFNEASEAEKERDEAERLRKESEISRDNKYTQLESTVQTLVNDTNDYVSTLEQQLTNYINASVISNSEIDTIIANALK